MKKLFNILIGFLICFVAVTKLSSWFFHFSDQTNYIISTITFSLIGLSALIYTTIAKNIYIKILLAFIGIYLISFNYCPMLFRENYIAIIFIFVYYFAYKYAKKTTNN